MKNAIDNKMNKRVVLFDEFASACDFFDTEVNVNDGYGCTHKKQEETELVEGVKQGKCFCFSCPLGIVAEDEDLSRDDIDWDGLCEDGEVSESEYLLINIHEETTEEEKKALKNYDRYSNRYNPDYKD